MEKQFLKMPLDKEKNIWSETFQITQRTKETWRIFIKVKLVT